MTVCNMSIEAGARAGMIAPDDDHLRLPRRAGRARRRATAWDEAVARWRTLPTDAGRRATTARSPSTPRRSSR